MDPLSALHNISAVDGRYRDACKEISTYFSEAALIRNRIQVEVKWLLFLNEKEFFFKKVSDKAIKLLESLGTGTEEQIVRVKKIEEKTNHDVKAVEYLLKEEIEMLQNEELLKIKEYVHYLCTSEDINNICYAVSIQMCIHQILIPSINNLLDILKQMAISYADNSLLSKTHGQSASSTTFGKEMANFYQRIYKNVKVLKKIKIYGKCNGAVGNLNSHKIANPDVNWIDIIKEFVENNFLITYSNYCTQIQDHDYIAELSDCIARINTILIDLCVDIWLYISRNILKLKFTDTEIGSSTMPHKINPIDFENAEGNLYISNSLLKLFSAKLPISRLQRDLSDSTILRNIGTAFAHCLISYKSIKKGLLKIDINTDTIEKEFNENWAILAEPIQILFKKYLPNAYEEMKHLTRGKVVDQNTLHQFIKGKENEVPKEVTEQLLNLMPQTYTGYASELAKRVDKL